MKKILSTCMAVLFSVTTINAADEKVSLTINTTHTPESSTQIKTQVCNVDGTDPGQSLTLSIPVPDQASITMSYLEYIANKVVGFLIGQTMTFSFRCEVGTWINESEDYCFSHWSDNGGLVDNLSKQGTYTYSCTVETDKIYNETVSGKKFKDQTISYTKKSYTLANTLTAYWVQPKVTGATVTDFQPVTDPNQAVTDGKIVFTLAGDVDFSNYDLPGEVGKFEIATTAEAAYSKQNHQYVIPIKYTPTGIAGTYSAEMTLCSRYPKGEAENKCQTATISVTENYTPEFSATTRYDFGNVAKGSSKTTTAGYLQLQKTNYAANNAVWTAWIEDDDKGAFAISGLTPDGEGKYRPEDGEPMVKFAPSSSLEDGKCTATLHLICTYTDDAGNPFEDKADIELVGNAYTLQIPLLQFGYDDVESHDFGTVLVGETPVFSTSMAMANITNPNFTWSGNGDLNNIFTYAYESGNLDISVSQNAICGDYTAVLTATATSTSQEPEYKDKEITDALTIIAQIRLSEPTLSAYGGMGQVTLSWNKVTGASYYVLTRNSETILITDDNTVTSYIDQGLGNNTDYSYTVTAVYDQDNTYNTTSTATATTGVPALITITNANSTGLYTGTEQEGTFPYYAKRPIDVTAAFADDGTPLFNTLYIFGLTAPSTGTEITLPLVADANGDGVYDGSDTYEGSNAITPCYIYNKKENRYELQSTIPNMNPNQEAKPIGTITANGQKIYFTGYCPFASNGTGTSQIGVIRVDGGANAKIDLYFDNLQLYSRGHSAKGYVPTKVSEGANQGALSSDIIEENLTSAISSDLFIGTTASAFVFKTTSTSSPFYPTIHIRGNNKLDGNEGLLKADAMGIVTQYAGVYCAPIHLHMTDHKQLTTLSIDDIWPTNAAATSTERTNGILDLRPSHPVRPCVELGNEKCVVNFNGGQIYLRNTIQYTSNYSANFAIGHRRYGRSVNWNGINVTATMVGMGPFMSGGTVNFNDGTIHGQPIDDASWEAYSMESNFYSKNDLKCPSNTHINGGTFYCDVYACSASESPGGSPTNKHGDRLVSHVANVTSTNEKGLAIINFDEIADNLVCDDDSKYKGTTLADYYTDKNDIYGHNSLQAKGGQVKLMIPYMFTNVEPKKDIPITNWIVPIPSMAATVSMASMSFGGTKEVPTGVTKYLLYMEADDYLATALSSPDYTAPNVGYGDDLKITYNSAKYEVVSNTAPYKISNAQYIFKPVRGDEWILFSPPFDVTNVFVLESYPEEALAAMDNIDEARDLQARSTLDLLIHMCAKMEYEKSSLPLWSLYAIWYNDAKLINAGKRGAGAIPLTHFTGSNYAEANYYLQHTDGIWSVNGDRFQTDWKLVSGPEQIEHETGVTYPVLMKKGELYSLNFPYMYLGYGDENWDYWTGKYIIFEGLGEQIIFGSNFNGESAIVDNTSPYEVMIHRNPTFSKIENKAGYFLAENQFRRNEYGSVDPTGGYIPANNPLVVKNNMPMKISSIGVADGSITYEDVEDNQNGTTTGTPTIAGNRQMLVYTIEGGVGIIPVTAQQVSIFNAAGQLITTQYLTEETQVALPSGIYLVCGEKDQAKAIVK